LRHIIARHDHPAAGGFGRWILGRYLDTAAWTAVQFSTCLTGGHLHVMDTAYGAWTENRNTLDVAILTPQLQKLPPVAACYCTSACQGHMRMCAATLCPLCMLSHTVYGSTQSRRWMLCRWEHCGSSCWSVATGAACGSHHLHALLRALWSALQAKSCKRPSEMMVALAVLCSLGSGQVLCIIVAIC
jgi:hypothetical protein